MKSVALACVLACSMTVVQAAKPARSIDYEMKVQRAAEAAIWAMPAVAVQDILIFARKDLGADEGDIARRQQDLQAPSATEHPSQKYLVVRRV